MICLVTGGAGFIGSHLSEKLIDLGYEVICVDNLITGKKGNIKNLLGNPRFTFIKDDVLKIKRHQLHPDYIFHFASPASPRWYKRYPIETILVNTYGTYLLLELAVKVNCPILFASTSEIYGDPLEHPQKENYWGNVNPVGPRSCYDEAKRCGETLVSSYVRNFGIDARIIRIFNTYGPRMDKDDGRAVSNFVYQALSGKSLTIYGKGVQTRSFCYITDMVDGILKAAYTPGISGEVINMGNPEEVTIMELANLVTTLTKKKLKFVHKKLPPDDPARRQPFIVKAKNLLHWEPKVKLREGLKRTINSILEENSL